MDLSYDLWKIRSVSSDLPKSMFARWYGEAVAAHQTLTPLCFMRFFLLLFFFVVLLLLLLLLCVVAVLHDYTTIVYH